MPVSGVYATARGYLGSWSSYGCIIVRGDDVNKGGSPTDQIEYEYASENSSMIVLTNVFLGGEF